MRALVRPGGPGGPGGSRVLVAIMLLAVMVLEGLLSVL